MAPMTFLCCPRMPEQAPQQNPFRHFLLKKVMGSMAFGPSPPPGLPWAVPGAVQPGSPGAIDPMPLLSSKPLNELCSALPWHIEAGKELQCFHYHIGFN